MPILFKGFEYIDKAIITEELADSKDDIPWNLTYACANCLEELA